MYFEQQISEFLKERQKTVFELGQTKETSNEHVFNNFVAKIIPEGYKTFEQPKEQKQNKNIFYDLAFGLRAGQLVGYLESKSYQAPLDEAIDSKRRSNYNMENILFQNMEKIVLIQEGATVGSAEMEDEAEFDSLLYKWINFSNKTIETFKSAHEEFKMQVPVIARQLETTIEKQLKDNSEFKTKFFAFYEMMKESLGDGISEKSCQDMLIQHKMTIHLFKSIFQDTSFLQKNPIAKALDELTNIISYGATANIQEQLNRYFDEIQHAVSQLHDRHFQMEVLRAFYEAFYQAYDEKLADIMGIVYTPVEVVDFMVHATDDFLKTHFSKNLGSKGVHILDPCCGTGSFLAGVMNFLKTGDLEYKYKNEIHANEMSVMAYYIANLYLEKLYFDKIGNIELFDSFDNMCLVDTLDNLDNDAIRNSAHKKDEESLLGFKSMVNEENTQRIKKQNEKNIVVTIGNPPYNAKQKNQNDNNPNKVYAHMDKRIKETYVKESVAQKIPVYDMYTRFIRWSSDRLGDDGIISFITNRSFLEARGFDGFRKSVAKEFTHIYVLDLGGDVRKDPKISGTKHNVFGIQTGVAILFFLKAPESPQAPAIFYVNPFKSDSTKIEKLAYLKACTQDYKNLKNIPWQTLNPDKNGNWINQSESNFNTLPLELMNKEMKNKPYSQFMKEEHSSLFHLYSLGVTTNRDSWVYDIDKDNLSKKVNYFINTYNKEVDLWKNSNKKEKINDFVTKNIKWASNLLSKIQSQKDTIELNKKNFIRTLYRPFTYKEYYSEYDLTERTRRFKEIFPAQAPEENLIIAVNIGATSFASLMSNKIMDYATLVFGGGSTQCLPLYQYTRRDETGKLIKDHNINLKLVQKEGIDATHKEVFYYTYAILHHPLYRQLYAKDLQQELPRIPLLKTHFKALCALGEQLGNLHLYFDADTKDFTLDPCPLERVDAPKQSPSPKVKLSLKDDPRQSDFCDIILDDNTFLKNLPKRALSYKLGSRSAIEWVLEGFKEKKISPADGDIADTSSPLYTQFGYQPYSFSLHKDACIDSLSRVASVSLKTLDLIDQIGQFKLEEA